MPTNQFFDTGITHEEENLFQDLANEFIANHGIETYYIPRIHVQKDTVLNETTLSKFEQAYEIEMYLEETGGYTPNDLTLGQIGFTFSGASTTFAVSKTRFRAEIPNDQLNKPNVPNVGDVLYIPITRQMMEIKEVDTRDPYVSGGSIFMYRLQTEPFKYSHEEFDINPLASPFQPEGDSNFIDNYFIDGSLANIIVPTADSDLITVDGRVHTIDMDGGSDFEGIGADEALTVDSTGATADTSIIDTNDLGRQGVTQSKDSAAKNYDIASEAEKYTVDEPDDPTIFGFT